MCQSRFIRKICGWQEGVLIELSSTDKSWSSSKHVCLKERFYANITTYVTDTHKHTQHKCPLVHLKSLYGSVNSTLPF